MPIRNVSDKHRWSTAGNTVFGKQATYNGRRRINPVFEYGKEPNGYDGRYYIESLDKNRYSVVHETLGVTSLTAGYTPPVRVIHLDGTLGECKRWLADLIDGFYRREANDAT